MTEVAELIVACREPPIVRAIALKVAWIRLAVRQINERNITIVVKIIGVLVVNAARIKAHERILREEERTARSHADVELDAIVTIAILIMISFGRARPSTAISDRCLRLARPSRVVHVSRNRMRRRRNGQQVGDHGFVESGDPVIDVPRPLRRPVPQQGVTFRGAPEPVPLHSLPKMRNSPINTLLLFTYSLEILARGQQSFHQKRGLHQIAAVVEHAKNQHALRCRAIQEVGPGTVVPRCFFEEVQDSREPFHALRARNEPAIHSDDQYHNAKTGGASRDNAIVSRNILERCPRVRMSPVLPVIAKACLLQHVEQFVVG